MKLRSPYDVAKQTGLPYVKSMAYIRIDKRYYVSEATLNAFLTQESAIEITSTEN